MKGRIVPLLFALLGVVQSTGTLLGNTLIVTNTDDAGTGSLRQALIDSNASTGVLDTIAFNIPGAGVKTISPMSPLPPITDPVVIDGYAQPGAAENSDPGGFNGTLLIELNGADAGIDVSGLTITAANCTVRGLVINRFDENGIRLEGANNVVEGNLIGTATTGTSRLGNASAGVDVFAAPFNTIGGDTAGARNVISANLSAGVVLDQTATGGTLVQGNLIGTDITGTVALGNSGNGILIQDAGVTIGGATVEAGNLISGNDDDGIFVSGAGSSGTTILHNWIGTQVGGTDPLGNGSDGVELSSSDPPSYMFVGDANIIAFNGARGVFVSGGSGNLIFANSIFSNGGLGIDLGDAGVTPNDAGDADDGPNGLQNFPLLISATRSGGKTSIAGTFNSTPDSTFLLEFFASSVADPSGHGEGQTFLGEQDVTTDGSGNVIFDAELSALPPLGQTVISATATDGFHNTSEFSPTVAFVNLASRLLNASTRLDVQTGDDVLIAGFIITGPDTDLVKVMVRAIGPSLAGAGLAGVLDDPIWSYINRTAQL